jgi:hypothetical protein
LTILVPRSRGLDKPDQRRGLDTPLVPRGYSTTEGGLDKLDQRWGLDTPLVPRGYSTSEAVSTSEGGGNRAAVGCVGPA